MFLLDGPVAVLGKQAAADQMVPRLTERFRAESGRPPSRSEALLTRGLRGCVSYPVDLGTQQTLAGLGLPALPASSSAQL